MSAVTDWWTEFFDGPFGELQFVGINEANSKREVDVLEKILELYRGGCGWSRTS